jgi:hypothetical protein
MRPELVARRRLEIAAGHSPYVGLTVGSPDDERPQPPSIGLRCATSPSNIAIGDLPPATLRRMIFRILNENGRPVLIAWDEEAKRRVQIEAHRRQVERRARLDAHRDREQYRRLLRKLPEPKRGRYERIKEKHGLDAALILLLEPREPQPWYLWHLRKLPPKARPAFAKIAKERGPAAAIRAIHARAVRAHPLS